MMHGIFLKVIDQSNLSHSKNIIQIQHLGIHASVFVDYLRKLLLGFFGADVSGASYQPQTHFFAKAAIQLAEESPILSKNLWLKLTLVRFFIHNVEHLQC